MRAPRVGEVRNYHSRLHYTTGHSREQVAMEAGKGGRKVPRNTYHQFHRLSCHPAFSTRYGCLLCPVCNKGFTSIKDYTDHYMTHRPTREEAAEHLDWKAFGRHFESTMLGRYKHEKQDCDGVQRV